MLFMKASSPIAATSVDRTRNSKGFVVNKNTGVAFVGAKPRNYGKNPFAGQRNTMEPKRKRHKHGSNKAVHAVLDHREKDLRNSNAT